MERVLEALVGRDRGRDAASGRAGQLRSGLLAEGARKFHDALEFGALRRVGACNQADNEPRDHGIDPRRVQSQPKRDAHHGGSLGTPRVGRIAKGDEGAEQSDRDHERDRRYVARVHGGDHDQSDEIVDHRHREEPHPEARAAGRHYCEETQRKRRVGGHCSSPAMPSRTAEIEGQVDGYRQSHAAKGCHQRDHHVAPLPQLTYREFALGLEPDDEEEERHQALVHPVTQVQRDTGVAEVDRKPGRPRRLVGVRPG